MPWAAAILNRRTKLRDLVHATVAPCRRAAGVIGCDGEHLCGILESSSSGIRFMPLFEYACRECSAEFELLVGVGDKPSCPQCGTKKLEKLMSAAAGRATAGSALPIRDACPPPEAGPCSPHCCRLPQ